MSRCSVEFVLDIEAPEGFCAFNHPASCFRDRGSRLVGGMGWGAGGGGVNYFTV